MPQTSAAEEIWRRVDAHPDYEVSATGRVRSRRRNGDWRLMRPTPDARGYRRVHLRGADGKKRSRLVHRLVAEAFMPNPGGLADVAHERGVRAGDAVDNLRWSTHRDNQMDMRRHGTMQDGEKCISAKLTAHQVGQIRAIRQQSGRGSQARLAEVFGISVAQVSRIVNGRRWASTYGDQHG
jgi:hypothetical protein